MNTLELKLSLIEQFTQINELLKSTINLFIRSVLSLSKYTPYGIAAG